jgi:WD40 repeat protein
MLLTACGVPQNIPAKGNSVNNLVVLPSETPLQVFGATQQISTPTGVKSAEPSPSATSSETALPAAPSGDWQISAASVGNVQLLLEIKPGEIGKVYDLAWSPDGKILAAAGETGVILMDGKSLETIRVLEAVAPCSEIVFNKDGNRLAGTGLTSVAQVWDVQEGRLLQAIPGAGQQPALSPDGKILAAAEDDVVFNDTVQMYTSTINLYYVESGKLFKTFTYLTAFSYWNSSYVSTDGLFFSTDGKKIQAVNNFGDVHLWEIATGNKLGTNFNDNSRMRLSTGMCYTSGSYATSYLLGCDYLYLDPPCNEDDVNCNPVFKVRYELGFWETSQYRRYQNQIFVEPDMGLLGLTYEPLQNRVAIWDYHKLNIWDTKNFRAKLYTIPREGSFVWESLMGNCQDCIPNNMEFNPQNGNVIAVSYLGKIALWDVANDALLAVYENDTHFVSSAALGTHQGLPQLIVGFSDGTISFADAQKNEEDRFLAHDKNVTRLISNTDEKHLISVGIDGKLHGWTLGQILPEYTIKLSGSPNFAVNNLSGVFAVSSMAGESSNVLSRDEKSYPNWQALLVRSGGEEGLALSWDELWLTKAGGEYGGVSLWNAQSGAFIRNYQMPVDSEDKLGDVSISPDGSLIAAISGEEVLFWQANQSSLQVRIKTDSIPLVDPTNLDFNPNGCLLVVGDRFGKIYLLDAENKQIVKEWQAHQAAVTDVSFSRDGRLLLSIGRDGAARLWGQEGVLFLPTGGLAPVSCHLSSVPVTSTPVTPTITSTPVTPTVTPTLLPFYRNLSLQEPVLNGNDVLQLQQRLYELGYTEVGYPDGVFGSKTDQAVRRFQERNNLVVDGIVGPITWNLLFSKNAK